MPPSAPSPTEAPPVRSPSAFVGLAALFGAIYFIQGITEPTEGLIAQPVRSMLKSWGRSAGEIATFSGLLAIPWMLKPLYGTMTDFLPVFGARRRPWLILASAATCFGLAWLWAHPPAAGFEGKLLWLLIIPAVGVAFTDVVVDALMVERGQPLGLTGRLQSVQWAAMYAGSILAGTLGGWFSQHSMQQRGFLVGAFAGGASLLLAIVFVREPRRPRGTGSEFRAHARALRRALPTRRFLGAAAFLFLWSFNPFSSSILYLYATRQLGVPEQVYGNTVSVSAVGSILGCLAYGFYCRRLSSRNLIHLSIAAGVATTLMFMALQGPKSAFLIAGITGFTYMTGNLVQLDLAARVCPLHVAGTMFAVLMGVSNLGISAGELWGGPMYDRWAKAWGASPAFHLLVITGAATTALCWLLLPLLRDVEVAADTIPAESS